MSEEQKPEIIMDEIIEKLKNTIFKENKTSGSDSLCKVDETYTDYTNCATEKDDTTEHALNPDLPPGKCGSVEINKNCIDFFFEKLNELTDEQKLTLNSLKYILKSQNKTRSFSIWGYLLITFNYDYLSRLSEQLEVKFSEDDVVYIKNIVNQSNSSNPLITYKNPFITSKIINFLKTLPIDVLKTLPIDVLKNLPIDVLENLPINVLKNLPIDVLENLPIDVLENLPINVLKTLPSNILFKLSQGKFDELSKNNLLSKTKMKARTVGRVKGWFGYGGTKKKRASKRRKNNKRSRRIN